MGAVSQNVLEWPCPKTKKASLAIKGQRSARPQMPLVIGCLLLEPKDVSALVIHGNPGTPYSLWPGREPYSRLILDLPLFSARPDCQTSGDLGEMKLKRP